MFEKMAERTSAYNDASDNLKHARANYINSLNVAATQSMISRLQDLTNNLQKSITANSSGINTDLATSLKDMQSTISKLTADYNQINSGLWTQNMTGLQGIQDTLTGTLGNTNTVVCNGYGCSMSATTQKKLLDTSWTIDGVKHSMDKANQDFLKLIPKVSNLSNQINKLSKNAGYQDSINQINTLVTQLQNGISGSSDDAKDNLEKAVSEANQAQGLLSATYEAIIALEQMKAAATQTINSEQQSFSHLVSNLSSNMTKLNFASSLATDSRLAKLSNPYMQDTEFAAYINAIKNKSLAANTVRANNNSGGNSASDYKNFLSDAVYGYDVLRFKKNNNLWGNVGTIIGNSHSINSVSGVFSFGYDAWVKNMVLGAYGSYAYTTNGIANTSSKNQSHNADIGFYSRYFLGQNEIDLNLGESFGFNFLQFKESLLDTTLKSNSVSFQTHLDLVYGYVFKVGKGWFTKPFIGLNYNYGYNLGMQAKATDISMGFDPYQTHYGAVQVGLEIRKYFNDNQSYFYIAPAFYQGVLFKNSQSVQTRIYESSFVQNATEFNKNQSIDTSFLLKAGGEWQATENIFVNISVGAKLGNLNQYGMLNLGGRWVF